MDKTALLRGIVSAAMRNARRNLSCSEFIIRLILHHIEFRSHPFAFCA